MELENILLLVDELDRKGIEKSLIVDIIINESKKPYIEDERTSKDQ